MIEKLLEKKTLSNSANSHSPNLPNKPLDPSSSTFIPQMPAQASFGAQQVHIGPVINSTIADNNPIALLVDDNAINMRLLAAFMTKLGILFQQAANGQEALNTYKAAFGSFFVVFMDISMPVMNGIAATLRIRQFEDDSGLHRTPIVALTGLASAAARIEALEAGVDDYITKPVSFKVLQKAVEKLRKRPSEVA